MEKEEVRNNLERKGYLTRDEEGNRIFTQKGLEHVKKLFKKPSYAMLAMKEIKSHPKEKQREIVKNIRRFQDEK